MAAGNFTVLNVALKKLADGTIDLDSHVMKICVCDKTQTISASFTGGSGQAHYADLTGEVPAEGGYATTGHALTGVTWSQTGGVAAFDADDANWVGCTMVAKYAVVYDDSATNKDILGFVDLNTTDADGVTVSAGDLIIMWNSAGIFTLQRAA